MESILERFSDNLTEVEYITNPAIARDEEIKKLILVSNDPFLFLCFSMLSIIQ